MSEQNSTGPEPGPVTDTEQAEQVELVRETGNEATEDDEEAVLRELYGAPDEDGVYGPRGAVEEGDV